VSYTLFRFVGFICKPFFIRKKSSFYRTVVLEMCKMYTFDQYLWLVIINTYTTKQSNMQI